MRPSRALVCTVIATALVRAWVAAHTGLTDDEAYYRLWALAPAAGYLDHPPMVAWMIAAGRSLAGDHPLGIRLAAVLTSLVGPLVLWRTGSILFGRVVAERTVWLALAMPLLAVGAVIMTPDTPSLLFWGLGVWALAELNASGRANWWLAFGLFAGLGLLSKYTNLFLGAGVACWLILLPANRHWLRSWQFWAGGVLCGLVALPVVSWNLDHHWASFAKQFGRAAHDGGTSLANLTELFAAYLGLASPLIALLALFGLGVVLRAALAGTGPAHAFLAAGIVPLLVYLLSHAIHDRVQPNWPAPLYPALAMCAALWLERCGPRWRLAMFSAALCIGFGLSGLVYAHALRPIVTLFGGKDPTAQMRGWQQLAIEVDGLRQAHGACWVATSSYATTGQLAYALAGAAPVVQLTEGIRYVHLPHVGDAVLNCPALYVELERRQRPELLRARFGSTAFLGLLTRRYRGTPIAFYAVYRLADPIGSVLSP